MKPTADTAVRHVIVGAEHAGQRLDNYLIRELYGVPRSKVYRIIRKGEVRVNGSRSKPSLRLAEGDRVRIPPVVTVQRDKQIPITNIDKTIIYESKLLLIINKPPGLAVHGGSGIASGVIESLRTLRSEPDLELVHRLDRDTSGCLMIARKRSYLRALQRALAERSGIRKRYLAVVHGKWSVRKQQIDVPLIRNVLKSGERISQVDEHGKPAQTNFQVLSQGDDTSLLEVSPVTGRTHQIRVHTAYNGHPIIGDQKYGDPVRDAALEVPVSRMLLHAFSLTVPVLGDAPALHVEAPADSKFGLK